MPVGPLQQRVLQGGLSTLNTLNPFASLQPGYTDPKPMPGESPFAYQHRMSVLANAKRLDSFAGNVGQEAVKGANYIFGSEASEQQKRAAAAPKPTASSVFPTSFADAKYDELERLYGGDVAPLLKQIRMQGERTNYGPQGDPRYQNARTGAYTPYQITSKTRELFMNNPGFRFDPWSSPENAVKAAAQILREHGGIKNPAAAVAGYFGGARAAANPNASFGDGNLSVNQYVNRVLYGGQGQPGTLQSPFDPRYAQQAMSYLDQAKQAAMQPTQTVFNGDPMPELPAPTPVPKTDFAAADAALEQLRPVEMAEREMKDIQWKNFWGGIGRAMASSPSGEGLGSFFLRLGGGALMAKGAAGDEIQQRKDAYDAKLAKFNAALYEHNFTKAQVVHNELVMDWQANQQYVANKFQQALGVWQANTKVQLVGNQLVNQYTDPKTGNVTVSTVPLKSLIEADDARDRANISMSMFGQQNSANAQVTGIGNRIQGQIVLGQAAQALADENTSPDERAAAAAFGPLSTVKYVVDKQLMSSILGPDELESMNEDIMTQLASTGMMAGTKEWNAAFREAAIGRMLIAIQDKPTFERMMSQFGQAADLYGAYERSINTTTTAQSRTKAGNQVFTNTTRYEGDEE